MSLSSESHERVRGALFLDFDNVFSSLAEQDPGIAEDFATNPGLWMDRLATISAKGLPTERDFLIRRCYLNPNGFFNFKAPVKSKAFGSYRAFFVRAGFEVVDCPALTSRGKNGADIRIVIDALDALAHPTRFDEFVLLSSDADFTPLLLRLRAHDRRTLVVGAGLHSAAYAAVADQVIGADEFMRAVKRLAKPSSPAAQMAPPPTATPPPGAVVAATFSASNPLRAQPTDKEFARVVRERLATEIAPISLGALSQAMFNHFGSDMAPGWLGKGTFKRLLESLDLGRFQFSSSGPGFLYDPERHRPPGGTDASKGEFQRAHPELFSFARKISQLTEAPLLSPQQYVVLFEELASEVNAQGFDFSRTSKSVRNRCATRTEGIGRASVSVAVKGILFAGHKFGSTDAGQESAQQLGKAFVRNVTSLCEAAQFELGEDDRRQLGEWLAPQ